MNRSKKTAWPWATVALVACPVACLVSACQVSACAAPRQFSSAALTADTEVADGSAGSGYRVVMDATACFLDGLWSDALGERGERREQGEEARCRQVLIDIRNHDGAGYAQLRAIDAGMVDNIIQRIVMLAADDPKEAAHAPELITLTRLVAETARETMHARRAADTLKNAPVSAPPAYANRKIAAAPEIEGSVALHALFHADVGIYTPEADTIALLFAAERMEIAHGLPMHLKVNAVGVALHDALGVRPPEVPNDSSAALPNGTWLAYLTRSAAVSEHGVPQSVTDPYARELLAWNGTLAGIGDRLAGSAAALPDGTSLQRVATAVAQRFDDQYRETREGL